MLLREASPHARDLITLLSEGSVVLFGLKRTFDRSVGLPAVNPFSHHSRAPDPDSYSESPLRLPLLFSRGGVCLLTLVSNSRLG